MNRVFESKMYPLPQFHDYSTARAPWKWNAKKLQLFFQYADRFEIYPNPLTRADIMASLARAWKSLESKLAKLRDEDRDEYPETKQASEQWMEDQLLLLKETRPPSRIDTTATSALGTAVATLIGAAL